MGKDKDYADDSSTSHDEKEETASEAGEEDADEDNADEEKLQSLKEANIKALLDNSLQTCCKPVLSKILTLKEGELQLRRAFRSPQPGAPSCSQALKQRLLARKRFVPWGTTKPFVAPIPPAPPAAKLEPDAAPAEEELPDGIEPLTLWEPAEGEEGSPILVDNMLTRFLRPHQREGVQFMFECVTGLRMKEGRGCILADDMGLGKTLQGITLLWTLLQSGTEVLGGTPLAKRVIIVCPTSLVSNWDNECSKWLKGKVRTLPLCESSRDDVISSVAQFLHPFSPYQVLIISYETFRLHAERFKGASACDLLICDEAHRLKNDSTLTNRALDSLQCPRRVLLSGTPMQNHLDEFYAMVDFCNPGVLGTPGEFRKHFEVPILAGREPGALEEEVQLGEERSAELSRIVNQFIMRRTNALLSQHLPPKVVEVVCCRMTPLQQQLYCHFLESNAARRLLNGAKATGVLSAITSLKKLCNHPKLIYDAVNNKHDEGALAEGFEDVGKLFPPGLFDGGRGGRPAMAVGWEETSGKMALLARMLHFLFTETDDRIVIVSNYTQTLDLVASLCRERCYPFLRLDGSTSINKRQKLVKIFNDPGDKQFVFLLSSKAGGCGLNLIGANRLVLFDPDWNPANDKQAAARVWRDGQKKRVFVYRMLTTGTIEEKVFQRQMSKEGLQQVVSSKGGKAAANMMSAEELRDLFSISSGSFSDTYDSIIRSDGGACAGAEGKGMNGASDTGNPGDEAAAATGPGSNGSVIFREQLGAPSEDDLKNWGFHSSPSTVPDPILQRSAGEDVTFVFTLQVDGRAIDETPSGRLHAGGGVIRGPASTIRPLSTNPSRLSAPLPSAPARHSAPATLARGTPKAAASGQGTRRQITTPAPACMPVSQPSSDSAANPAGGTAGNQPQGSKLAGLSALPALNRQRHTMPHIGQASNTFQVANVETCNILQASRGSPQQTSNHATQSANQALNQAADQDVDYGLKQGPSQRAGSHTSGQMPAGNTDCSLTHAWGQQSTCSPIRKGGNDSTHATPDCRAYSMNNMGKGNTPPSSKSRVMDRNLQGPSSKQTSMSPLNRGKENTSAAAALAAVSGGGDSGGAVSGQKPRSGTSRLRLSSTGNDAVPTKKLKTLGSKTLKMIIDDDFM